MFQCTGGGGLPARFHGMGRQTAMCPFSTGFNMMILLTINSHKTPKQHGKVLEFYRNFLLLHQMWSDLVQCALITQVITFKL